MTSAYPLPVDELTDRIRDHATRTQSWPSLRTVMTEFRVGRPKATAALDALRTAGFDPTPAGPAGGLHVVPTAPDTTPDPVPSTPDVPDESDPAEDTDDTASAPVDHAPAAVTDTSADDRAGSASAPLTGATDAPGTWSRFGPWPLVLIALGAFVSIWGGWVGLGELTGFGPIRLLPGIADQVVINSAITLPIGVEAYAAFALRAWLAPAAGLSYTARRFALWSAVGALALGAAGQIAYHLMVAAGITRAPWPITAFVACLPVVVLGCGAALTHLIHHTATADRKDA